MIVLTIFLVCVWILIYLNSKSKRQRELANKFPGPKPVPFLGNLFNFSVNDHEGAKKMISKGHQDFGEIYRVQIFNEIAFMISDPKVYELIFTSSVKHTAKHILYAFLQPWLGNGLILSHGSVWQKHRKILTPAFHFKILEQFVDVFDQQNQILVDKLRKHCDGSIIDVEPYISLLSMDIIGETSMGCKINAQSDADSLYVKSVHELTANISVRFSNMWKRSEILYSIFAHAEKKRVDELVKIVHAFTDDIIIKRRNKLLATEQQPIDAQKISDDDRIGGSKKMALLDILLQANVDNEPLTNEQIRAEVDTFMFAGHDTSSVTISSILYMLSRHKHVQDKIFDEIKTVVGSASNVSITYRHIHELKYIDLVIKETLRLMPSVPAIGRFIDEDIILDDGRIIPAGVNVTLNLFMTFTDPKYFKDPESFEPERFNAENTYEKLNPYAFVPFSAGSRNCIGQKFAMLSVKLSITKILLNFELIAMGEEPNIFFDVVSRSVNGFQMGLRPRMY